MEARPVEAANIAIPTNLTFVPIDFEKTSLAAGLEAAGFAFDAQTFCSCLGVLQYLTSYAVDATLRFVLSLPPSSEIVLSFVLPQEALSGSEAEMVAIAAQRTAEVREPWLSRLHADQLRSKLRVLGFSQISHLTPDEAHERYFRNRCDGLKGRQGEQLMRAVV